MSRRRKHQESDLSVRSRRQLEAWGVERAMANGVDVVPVGPTYFLADGRAARLVFVRDEEGRLCVGYAARNEPVWETIDAGPYSLRTLGYFQRRLRRVGRREDEMEDDEEEEISSRSSLK